MLLCSWQSYIKETTTTTTKSTVKYETPVADVENRQQRWSYRVD